MYCSAPAELTTIGSSTVPKIISQLTSNTAMLTLHAGVSMTALTQPGRIQWLHIEDIDTLGLSQQLKTLQTSRLVEIVGDSSDLTARGQQVFIGLDLCMPSHQQLIFRKALIVCPVPQSSLQNFPPLWGHHAPSSFLKPRTAFADVLELVEGASPVRNRVS